MAWNGERDRFADFLCEMQKLCDRFLSSERTRERGIQRKTVRICYDYKFKGKCARHHCPFAHVRAKPNGADINKYVFPLPPIVPLKKKALESLPRGEALCELPAFQGLDCLEKGKTSVQKMGHEARFIDCRVPECYVHRRTEVDRLVSQVLSGEMIHPTVSRERLAQAVGPKSLPLPFKNWEHYFCFARACFNSLRSSDCWPGQDGDCWELRTRLEYLGCKGCASVEPTK